jgi:hypothetical protein
MKIEIPFRVADARQILPGEFFGFWRESLPTLALAIKLGDQPLAFIFERTETSKTIPWVGEMPSDPLVRFPESVIRAEMTSRMDETMGIVEGTFVAASSGHFMRGGSSFARRATVNLATGTAETINAENAIQLGKWEIGQWREDRFHAVFSFDWKATRGVRQ